MDHYSMPSPFGGMSATYMEGYAPYPQPHSHHGQQQPLPAHPADSKPHSHSPTPTRLQGEPAYCSGRHCCHWHTPGQYPCNAHFSSAADLDAHICSVHAIRTTHPSNTSEALTYHCHWSGCTSNQPFTTKPKLTRHIHSHTSYKPYSCSHPACDKAFVTKEQLKNHLTTHTRSRAYVCEECGKAFAVKTALTSHMNVHRGVKPYVCEECGKGFADSSNLSKHRAIHRRKGPAKAGSAGSSRGRRKSSVAITTNADVGEMLMSPMIMSPIYGRNDMVPQQQGFAPLPYPAAWSTATPTPSLESSHAMIEQPYWVDAAGHCHGRPCFDTSCDQPVKIPCRSVSPCLSLPCSARGCTVPPCDIQHCPVVTTGSETCSIPAESCAEACPMDACLSPDCTLPDCDWADCNFTDCLHSGNELLHCSNDLAHCHHPDDEFPDCDFADCDQLCAANLDCLCDNGEESSLATPSTESAIPATPVDHAHPHTPGIMRSANAECKTGHIGPHDPDDPACGLSEGFKRLREFVHGVDCGCHPSGMA